jgi:hypothetical protein
MGPQALSRKAPGSSRSAVLAPGRAGQRAARVTARQVVDRLEARLET